MDYTILPSLLRLFTILHFYIIFRLNNLFVQQLF